MVRTAIAVVVVVLALLPCPDVQAADISAAGSGVRLVTTGTEVRSDRTHSVLWDISRGPWVGYTPSGEFSNLVDMLATHEINSYETTSHLNEVDLSSFDMIVIGTILAWYSAYEAAELTAIQDFVSAGGGLLIMGEYPTSPNENITLISEAYGVTYPSEGGTCGSEITDFDAHDIFDGVTELAMVAPGPLFASAPSDTVAREFQGYAVVSLMGDCDVIATGDCSLWENDFLGADDNSTFALNVFECLTGADTAVESTSWGVVKSLYR